MRSLIWLVVAVAVSLGASVLGTYFVLRTDLPEILNPELKSLRLQHERLRQRDQSVQELLRVLTKPMMIQGPFQDRVHEVVLKGIVTKEGFIRAYRIDPNRVSDLGPREPSTVWQLMASETEVVTL